MIRQQPFPRYFTAGLTPGQTPFDQCQWETRTASIGNDKGTTLFEQQNVTVPADWSQTATNIVASKYFYGKLDSHERENSVAQLIHRVVDTITNWGTHDGHFPTPTDADNFRAELAHLTLTQKASFNSPVWFNVGIRECRGSGWIYDLSADRIAKIHSPAEAKPQTSACFILSVEDHLDSILELAKTEGMLFKWGSGCGTNLSPLREENAPLSGGGLASGPLSFMKGFDAFAGVIKSGGKTRRAAKMVILNVDHPDIEKFIAAKATEEKKAQTLIQAGYDASLDGDAYSSVFFQNANNSVRIADPFMQAVDADADWSTKSVTTGQPIKSFKARDLLRQIAQATHQCGDPGLQFDTTINRWHTCKTTGRINASNPCSEYMFLDDSACNLASLNLLKFLGADGQFDIEAFRHAVHTLILAQEILIDNSSYPTERIAANAHNFRSLGLGYANLGALLMAMGLPYDSQPGRDFAAAITAVMTAQAYLTSSHLAKSHGPFPGYAPNQQSFLEVIRMHRDAAARLNTSTLPPSLATAPLQCWDKALQSGHRHGCRNAQVTVLAPTGTIAFMMDCDTTGIEPDLALVKHKKLVGGGLLKIVNTTVPQALTKLGYSPTQIQQILAHINTTGTIEAAPDLNPEHLSIFDCSLRPASGSRAIPYTGHIHMMAAVQPFLSGAISKTINMPEDSTVDDIMSAYMQSWALGLKAVAIYRDNSKKVQPLNSSTTPTTDASPTAPIASVEVAPSRPPFRRKLPDERRALTHKFSVGGHEGYLTVGMYDDGTPGELFITIAKEGSTISGLMDTVATAISVNLQYGVPIKFIVDKFTHLRFEPSGWTGNPQIPYAKSIIDYIARWLGAKFVGPEYAQTEAGESSTLKPTATDTQQTLPFQPDADASVCAECGSLMTRNGTCYKCPNCFSTSGCS